MEKMALGFARIAQGLAGLSEVLEPAEIESALTLASMTTVFVAPPALVLGQFSTAALEG